MFTDLFSGLIIVYFIITFFVCTEYSLIIVNFVSQDSAFLAKKRDSRAPSMSRTDASWLGPNPTRPIPPLLAGGEQGLLRQHPLQGLRELLRQGLGGGLQPLQHPRPAGGRTADAGGSVQIWLRWSNPFWYHFRVSIFTTHFRTYLSGGIGMFTGGTGFGPMAIWAFSASAQTRNSWSANQSPTCLRDSPAQGLGPKTGIKTATPKRPWVKIPYPQVHIPIQPLR